MSERVTVSLPDGGVRELDELCKRLDMNASELVRFAISKLWTLVLPWDDAAAGPLFEALSEMLSRPLVVEALQRRQAFRDSFRAAVVAGVKSAGFMGGPVSSSVREDESGRMVVSVRSARRRGPGGSGRFVQK